MPSNPLIFLLERVKGILVIKLGRHPAIPQYQRPILTQVYRFYLAPKGEFGLSE